LLSHVNPSALQAVKYGFVGLANTLVTAIVIFLCMFAGVELFTSNAAGYVVGIIFSFMINSIFTFEKKISPKRFSLFLCVCGLCYLLNLAAMKIFFLWQPEKHFLGQIVGMLIYTAVGFILNKIWVMK
jgi:putative flippase GtrA